MRVLTVTTGNILPISAFITDHIEKLEERSIATDCFLVKGKGIRGYLKNLSLLKNKIRSFQPDLIHAHYGLSGLLSTLQNDVPVVTTFHGSDINLSKIRPFSYLAYLRADASIFVSRDLAATIRARKYHYIPCGVDFDLFKPLSRSETREYFGMDPDRKYILFSSHFDNGVKNYALAEESIGLLEDPGIHVLELKGYDRKEVAMLMNAANLCLMTSKSEGSPQFIKEAMACGTPIVSTDVGDVREMIEKTDGCYVTDSNPNSIARSIKNALQFTGKTHGREDIRSMDSETITDQIIEVYNTILRRDLR